MTQKGVPGIAFSHQRLSHREANENPGEPARMRGVGLAGLVAIAAIGCMGDRMTTVENTVSRRFALREPVVTPDVVELHYIFLERDEADPLINTKIWEEADEQAYSLDQREEIAANGLRIGKLGGRLSPELLKLLDSQKPNGRRHQCHAGSLAKVQTTEVTPSFNLFAVTGGHAKGETIENAQGYLYLVPTLEDSDAVSLALSPEIEHGERQNKRLPAPDLSGWQIRCERETRSFPDLKVTLELASGEYLLVGCYPAKRGTLGYQFFTRDGETARKQTVLVIRAVRPTREALAAAGHNVDDFFFPKIRKSTGSLRSLVAETLWGGTKPAGDGVAAAPVESKGDEESRAEAAAPAPNSEALNPPLGN